MLGLMTAMPEEAERLLADFDEGVTHIEHGRRVFHVGTLHGVETVAVVSRCGKVSAATTATELVVRFNVSRILFTGVAGSVDPAVHIGDVVVADAFMQHDFDATPIWPVHVIPFLEIAEFPADKDHGTELVKASEAFLAGDLDPSVLPDSPDRAGRTPTVHRGMVVSGDQFITQASHGQSIKRACPGALCVEMEGAAVAQVCYEYGVPVSVCRVISDRADDAATSDYTVSLGAFAATYSGGIVRRYLSR